MKLLIKSFLLLIVLFPGLIKAQLNEMDTLKWHSQLTASGSLLAGNVNRFLLLGRLEAAHVDERRGFSTRIDYQFGTRNHDKTENDLVTYNFLYLNPMKRIYPYLMVILETNYRRSIKFRYQAGPGVSINLINRPNNLMRISLSGTYEATKFGGNVFNKGIDSTSSLIRTARLTLRLYGKYKIVPGKFHLLYEIWYQQSLTRRNNYRLYYENTIDIPFTNRFSFKSILRYTHESFHLKGIKDWDLFWVFGLSVKTN